MRTVPSKENALTVLFNRTCVLLLSLLFNNSERMFYLREIARKINTGAGTVQRELVKLTAAELVIREVRGKQVYYGANKNSHVFTELRGLIIKTFGLADSIRDALSPLSKNIVFAFIYGSQADGTAASDSDIDLMIVGRVGEMELHKAIGNAERKLEKPVNYSLFDLEEFRKRKKEKGGFINRIAAGRKIMLMGDQNEV